MARGKPSPLLTRKAPDGQSYTKSEFFAFFAGYSEWDAAAMGSDLPEAVCASRSGATRRLPANPPPGRPHPQAGSHPHGSSNRSGRRARGPAISSRIHDDGLSYSGPMVSFIRSQGLSSDDEGVAEEEEEEEEEAEGAFEGVSAKFSSALALDGATKPAPRELPPSAEAPGAGEKESPAAGEARVGREALLQLRSGPAGAAACLTEATSIGYLMLKRMGWVDGQGLGRHGSGMVMPVAVTAAQHYEGVGLGCACTRAYCMNCAIRACMHMDGRWSGAACKPICKPPSHGRGPSPHGHGQIHLHAFTWTWTDTPARLHMAMDMDMDRYVHG